MSRVTYDAGNLTIEVDGLDTVAAALGDLKKKTPAAAKVAINATARQARKLMIAKAKARYAVNAAGRRHLKDLVQRKKASNTSLSAELHIAKMRNDLGYFQHRPTERFTGREVLHHAPKYVKARVLRSYRVHIVLHGLLPRLATRSRSGAAQGGGTRTARWKSW